VNGSGFNVGTALFWNATQLATTLVNAGQMTASVPANLIAQAASASVTAQGGGQVSNALSFTVAQPPLVLTSISPSTAVSGGPALTVTVNGSGFSANAAVTWNGTALATSFVSAAQLTAIVPANLIASAGTAAVGVSAPNQTSPAPLSFSITQGFFLTSLSPTSIAAGTLVTTTLTVIGSGFAAGTQVRWNTSALITTVVNATQMTASVVPSIIPAASTVVSVTAQSGNLISNALTVTITPPPVTLSSLSPSTAVAGTQTVSLTVNGSQFTSATQITWNGTALASKLVSATQLSATVPAAMLTTPGTASVTVTAQPQPAPLIFTITKPLTPVAPVVPVAPPLPVAPAAAKKKPAAAKTKPTTSTKPKA